MKRNARAVLLIAAAILAGIPAGAKSLPSKPDVYKSWTAEVEIPGHHLDVTFVKPVKPHSPAYLVLFATGDAGWMGVSGDLFEHLAEEGYDLAAFSSRDIVKHIKGEKGSVTVPAAAASIDSMIVQARSALGLPEKTPVIVTGFSRGANLVVLTAGIKSLQHHVGGAVAMALTRETDFLEAPPPGERPPGIQLDEKGRFQTYPAIALAGPIPFAVIQSEGDSYVPADEARKLFGPNTPTRRLYEVDSRNHGFSGGKDELIRDLDDALDWIEASLPAN